MKIILILLSLFLVSTSLYANRVAEAEYMTKINVLLDEGIALSKIATSRTQNKKIKMMAEKIAKDQKEKERFEKLRGKYYADVVVLEDANAASRTPETIATSGEQFDKDYLDLMIKKHKEEILLTSKMLPDLERRAVHHMAVKLAKKKGNEIARIEKIKNTL